MVAYHPDARRTAVRHLQLPQYPELRHRFLIRGVYAGVDAAVPD